MSEEYDLKKSEKGIGQLYPILKSKDGKIIDGFHREASDPNWKSIVLPEIDTEEKLLIARAVSNWHRREVPKEEKAEWIDGLAEIYQKQGLQVGSPKQANQIINKITEVTGLTPQTVRNYLSKKYRQTPPENLAELNVPKIPASERVENILGEKGAERFRKEVLEEEKLKPEERAKLKEEQQRKKEEREQKQILQKAKTLKAKELIKDKDFQREVIREISKPQIVKVTDPCPSGVCELPQTFDAGPPIDIMAIRLAEFWKSNPECKCKNCSHFNECGVIRC